MVERLWQDSGNRVAICILTLPELKGRLAEEVPTGMRSNGHSANTSTNSR